LNGGNVCEKQALAAWFPQYTPHSITETDPSNNKKQKMVRPKVWSFRSFCCYLCLVSVDRVHQPSKNKKQKMVRPKVWSFRSFCSYLVDVTVVCIPHSTMNNQPSTTRRGKWVKPKVLWISLLLVLLGWCTWFTQKDITQVEQEAENDKSAGFSFFIASVPTWVRYCCVHQVQIPSTIRSRKWSDRRSELFVASVVTCICTCCTSRPEIDNK